MVGDRGSRYCVISLNAFTPQTNQSRKPLSDRGHWHIRLVPNRRDSEQIIARKLNRVLVNDSRLATFPNSEADFTGPGISDHSPRGVTIRQK